MADNIKPMGIQVDDGRRRVPITNNYGDEIGVFYFNPTDIGIIERYNKLAKGFDAILEPFDKLPETDEKDSNEETDKLRIEALNEAKNRLNNAVNELFGGDCAGAFFGSIHPFSPVNGKFYCEIVFEVVGRYISEQFNRETAQISERVSKYTKRFQKR